jgi:hypothetical protein
MGQHTRDTVDLEASRKRRAEEEPGPSCSKKVPTVEKKKRGTITPHHSEIFCKYSSQGIPSKIASFLELTNTKLLPSK